MSSHALLSASGAHKWLNCTPSARLEETLPESTSEYAEEGRLAHEIGELKLRKQFVEPMGTRKFTNQLKKLQDNPRYKPEMMQNTDAYMDYVSGIMHGYSTPPYIAVEKRLNYSSYAPEGFGTGDCVIIGGNTIHVIDYKNGQGVPVSAVDNPQMKLYALGAYTAYAFLFPLEKVKLGIVQPRVGEPSEWETSVPELLAWGESIKLVAQRAFKGEGEFLPGEHCRFCRAKALCRARAEGNLSLEEFKLMKPPLISNDEVGQILERAQHLAAWAKHLQDYALGECLQGREITGWKAVHGRGDRQFVNQDEAFKILLESGIAEPMLYERKPLTVPGVEKLLGKGQYRELLSDTGHIELKPGKPTLVPLSDKRDAITRISAMDEFNVIGGSENE